MDTISDSPSQSNYATIQNVCRYVMRGSGASLLLKTNHVPMTVRYENIRTDGQTQYVAQPAFIPPQVTGPVLLFLSTPPSVSTSTPLTD